MRRSTRRSTTRRHVPRVRRGRRPDAADQPARAAAPHHRAALPLLAPSFSRLRVSADVVICSSSGWAHGAQVEGRKIVYCHTPARWLYQSDRYLRGRGRAMRAVAGAAPVAASSGGTSRRRRRPTLYLANSTVVAERIRSIYGIDAEVVPPPPALTPDGPAEAVERRGTRLSPLRLPAAAVQERRRGGRSVRVASRRAAGRRRQPARGAARCGCGRLERHVRRAMSRTLNCAGCTRTAERSSRLRTKTSD